MKIKVGVIGYGTIGKRVIDALLLQEDMEFIGVGVRSLNSSTLAASFNQNPLYLTEPEQLHNFQQANIKIEGDLEDLLEQVDVIIDCTQRGNAQKNLKLYQKYNLPVIVHGGEESEIGITFSSFVNYESAQNQNIIRIGSCNTTGLLRPLYALEQFFQVDSVFVSLVRCATDPNKADKGIVNGLSIVKGMSHHAEDVKLLIPHLNIYSQAVAAPMTHGHLGMLKVQLKEKINRQDVIDLFNRTPRIKIVSSDENKTTSHLSGQFTHKRRGDREELIIFEDSIEVINNELYFIISIHMESIVIPETIDCVRALFDPTTSKVQSIYKTDYALGIEKDYRYYDRYLSK